MKKILSSLIVIGVIAGSSLRLQAQTNSPIPPALQVAGAPAFDATGLSFTNVTWKAETGTKIGGDGGTLSYLSGSVDVSQLTSAIRLGSLADIGLMVEGSPSVIGNGFHDVGFDLLIIKNLPNWQLFAVLGYDRQFELQIGNYFDVGAGANYNLSRGTGISFLSTSGGSFTYVGARVDYQANNFSFSTTGSNATQKMVRIYVGYAF